ncbi:MAG: GH36-type glycosyl hydrolase domain-containing protein, partial [Balneolaceae bacterium]
DLESGIYWSAAHRPVNKEADRYDTWFHAGKVQTARVDEWVETFTEICVSPEDNIEFRKLTLTNYSNRTRKLEVTSYAEVVLNEQKADAAHPAFSNLFVQTEHIPEHHAVVARRRPRTSEEKPVWLVHTIASEDLNSLPEPLQYETDREQFIGRGRSLDSPAAMDAGSRLSGSTGNVPDPIVSLRRVIELKPGEKRSITFGLGLVSSRENAVVMADQYDNPYATDRVFELASIYGRVELDHIGISGEQAHYFQKLGGALLYGNEQLRAKEETLTRNRRTQSGLWAYGISGDLPVLLYRIRDVNHIRYVEQLLKAHMMWRLKGFAVDLVIIYDHPPSYIEELRDAIHRQVQASQERHLLNKRGGIFVIHGDDMPVDDRVLLETVAAVYMQDKLAKIDFSTIDTKKREPVTTEPYYRLARLSELNDDTPAVNNDLLFHNGYGGFSQTGKEYVIQLTLDSSGENLVYPPAPWINVIANPDFGFITSERGSDYTWSMNSRENRLTPWSNDAVIDPAGEAMYIRDETHRRFWSPTPGPSPGSTHYEVRHGFGYSRFISRTLNIDQEVTKWVAVDDPVKLIRLRLTNTDLISRTLSVFYYLEWVLGVFRDQSSRYVVTELDQDLSTIFAQNAYNNEFAGRVAFAAQFTDAELIDESFTTDRTYFIGKNKGVTNPQALRNEHLLTKRFGAGFDPCAASQMQIKLKSGETADLYFMLGESASFESAKKIIRRYRDSDVIESSLKGVHSFWDKKLERIQISTPAPELDIMFNGWLQYQNIACRMWGRSGFYQSGGAYGFRDQLQDASSAIYLDEQLARNQILKHAARQFREGDVLHWWHPPTGRGIRSKITDDLLWLPYVTAFYVLTTNDKEVLDEQVPFITARKLEEGEHEAYLTPENSEESASLYEHCCRAIDRSLTQGEHGLPLIGGGDWNDGMNRVGEQGKGESVWLGFFLYSVISDFLPYCKLYDDNARIEKYEQYRKQLKKHLNRQGWDGKWYRRAFYDDGTPLGSSENDECKIDAIAQAWAVISGVAPPKKAKKALESAGNYLVSEEEGIIRLLTPAFDKTPKNPGYIKGYMPGVRENGGQYTHGALWLIKAYAEMGYGDIATRLIRMISPVNHSTHKEDADRYKV